LSYSDHKLYIATNKREIYNTKFHKMLFSGSRSHNANISNLINACLQVHCEITKRKWKVNCEFWKFNSLSRTPIFL